MAIPELNFKQPNNTSESSGTKEEPTTGNVITAALNRATERDDKKELKKQKKALEKAKKRVNKLKEKDIEIPDDENIENLTGDKIKDLLEKLKKVKESLDPNEQNVVLEEEKKIDASLASKEVAKALGVEDVDLDTSGANKLKEIEEELEARVNSSRSIRAILGEKQDEITESLESKLQTTSDKKERVKLLAKIANRTKADFEKGQKVRLTDVMAEIPVEVTQDDPQTSKRRKALQVSAIIAEQQKLDELPKEDNRKKAVVADLNALASSKEESKRIKTQKYLENLTKLSLETQKILESDTDEVQGFAEQIDRLSSNSEVQETLADIKEMLNDNELKESFIKNSNDVIRSQIALKTVEDEIREKLTKPEKVNTKAFENEMKKEITKTVREMFPPNTALAVEAAQIRSKENFDEDKVREIEKQLQSYMARREVLQETLEAYVKKISTNIESVSSPDKIESAKEDILKKILNREGRNNKDKGLNDNLTGNTHLFLTTSGNKILFVEDESDMAILAPELANKDGQMSRNDIVEYIKTQTSTGDDLGDQQFQMAVRVSSGEEGKEYDETVLVVHRKFDEEKKKISSNQMQTAIAQLQTFGYHLGNRELTEAEAAALVQSSAAAIYHEMNHGIKDQYISARKRVLKSKLEKYKDSTDPYLRLRAEVIKDMVKTLEEGEVLDTRWRNAMDELAAKLSEIGKPEYMKEIREQKEEYNKETLIKLKDIYIFDPDTDPNLKLERTDLDRNDLDQTDEDILEVLDLVNTLINQDNRDKVIENIKNKYKLALTVEDGELYEKYKNHIDTNYPDPVQFLNYYILSYLGDGEFSGKYENEKYITGLERLISDLEELAEGVDQRYDSSLEQERNARESGVGSLDNDTNLKDPVSIANANLNKSPHQIKDPDGHFMAPLHWDVPIPGINYVQKYTRARLRYHLANRDKLYKGKFKGAGIDDFGDFWDRVKSNPGAVTNKDKGLLFTPEILGAWVRQAALHGKNPDQLLGYQLYNDAVDSRTGRVDKSRLSANYQDRKINAGLAGGLMSAWEKTPVANKLYPRMHSAPWGMAMEKVFGRGPIPRLIGRVFWGESVMPDADSYQKIGFDTAPKWKFLPGFKDGENALEPDGLPGVVLHQEGNMTPKWNHRENKWELAPRIPVEATLPSNEFHRQAHLSIMLGMMAKSGIDEGSLRFMVMKYLPELNFQNREGVPGYDITEYKKSLLSSDLNYRQRLRSGRYTAAEYHNKVLKDILNLNNADELGYDMQGLNDYESYSGLVNKNNEDANWSDGNKLVELDKRLQEQGISDTEITRGFVSEETIDEIVDFINSYLERGIGKEYAHTAEAKRVKQQAYMIRHVFRAMQHENAIRRIRKDFLFDGNTSADGTGQSISEIFSEWDSRVQTRVKELIDQGDIGRGEAKRQAYKEFLDSANDLTFWTETPSGEKKQVTLNSEQIEKLFLYKDVEGAPSGFVSNYNAEENGPFGLGDLEKIAFNTEWNMEKDSPGVDTLTIGGGFKLHKLEIQALQRNLYYIYSRDIMRRGLPPDAINIPGETQNLDKTLTADLWYKEPHYDTFGNEGYELTQEPDPDNPGQMRTRRGRKLTYSEGYFRTVVEKNQDLQKNLFRLFKITEGTDEEKLTELRRKWTGKEADGTEIPKEERTQNFKDLIEILSGNPNTMSQLFGDRASLQASFLNERNQLYTLKPVSPATELDMRYFEQGAIVHETEENLTRIEKQTGFYALMRLYLQEARRSIPYSKARSEIFKNHAKYIKYFRWAVLGITAYAAVTSPMPGMPLVLPMPPEIYMTMVALSYYEAYYLSVKQKYWGMRELNSIKYADEMFEFTNKLEGLIRQFKIPSSEEQEQYAALMSRYEKFFEGISDVDNEELQVKHNAATSFINNTVSSLMNSR